MSDSNTKIAVIMRSYNDIDVIRDTLDMLFRQSRQDFELWNFASQSTDGTLEVIQQYNQPDRIRLNDPADYNPGRILNEAVNSIDADIMVFLNSDATPKDQNWLERLVDPLMDPTVGAVFGRQVSRPDCRSLFVKDTERAFGMGNESAGWLHFFSMANSAARTTMLRRFPFETAVQYSEDIEWSYRLRCNGYRIQYVPDAVAIHSHNYTLAQSYRRHYGEGVADAFIFCENVINRSWWRSCALPFGMEVLRDMRWAVTRRSMDALLYSIPLRFSQKWARWRGIHYGRKHAVNPRLTARSSRATYTYDGNKSAESRVAMDQSIISAYVSDAVAPENFEALVLMGGYGRGEGGYRLNDGQPVPYNDYDYFVIVKDMSRKAVNTLQRQLKDVANRLEVIVGVEVDLAVMRTETLTTAPFTLMNAEMKWGHRVVTGNREVLDAMPDMPFDKLALGEFTRLMNNRGALLLMNSRMLSAGEEMNEQHREIFFKYLFKAVIACGDAFLAIEGIYHPSYVEKKKRLALLRHPPGRNFIKLYKLAVEQKFYPEPDRFRNEDCALWQRRVTDFWLSTFSRLEECRTHQQISNWKKYALPRLPKGQLETSQLIRNFAITLRDFGVWHTFRYLGWALRYPRERLISVLPLLLTSSSLHTPPDVIIPLAVPKGSDRLYVVDRYLRTWQRYA